MNSARTLVSVATYNEMENLPRLIPAIFAVASDVDILVIDDNSPDGTGKWVAELSRTDARVKLLHREKKEGLGRAILAGMQYAIAHEYTYLLNMDADFSHDPQYIPALREGMAEASVMIGSRYIRGGGVQDWPLKRRLMSWSVNIAARWLLGLAPRDCSGAFRCYEVALLQKLDFSAVQSRGYSFQEEILWHLKRLGARFQETPILFVDRERGLSKINSREAYTALWILYRFGQKNWLGF